MDSAYYKILLKIFGTDWWSFSQKEKEIATRVVDFYIGNKNDVGHEDVSLKVINACQQALAEEGEKWEDIMFRKTRERKIVMIRYAIFSIFWKRSFLPQEKKVAVLGGIFNRSTIIYAITQVEDWRKYNLKFREYYDRLSESVQNKL